MGPSRWKRRVRGRDTSRTLCRRPSRPGECRQASYEYVLLCASSLHLLCLIHYFRTTIVTSTVQGILSCLTAAFWGSVRPPTPNIHYWLTGGQFSDRYGRVRYLSFNIVPVLLANVAMVALAVAPEKVPGGYWFLVFTSALEGLIGGLSLLRLLSLRWS